MPDERGSIWLSGRVQAGVVLLIAAAVYLPFLGIGGFHSTEGHRVIPAYEMLDSGEWLVPTMFGQDYLRKPPGMPWAVAAMSALFGRTELAARLVSAASVMAMGLVACGFARRWFGPRAGLAAGLAVVLMPWMWEVGRAAEIEALNTLGVQIAVLAAIDVVVRAHRRRLAMLGLVAIGTVILLFAKGPAGLPAVAAGLVAGVLVARADGRAVLGRAGLAVLAAGCAGVVFGGYVLAAGARVDADAVTQGPGAFLWTEPWWVVAALPVAAFVASLPASLALVFPWGPDAAAEGRGDGAAVLRYRLARTLAFAWVLTVVGLAVAGVGNVRYTMPAVVVLGPLAGWVFSGIGAWLVPTRSAIARWVFFRRPVVWPSVLLVAAGVSIAGPEARRRATSGREAGVRMAAEVSAAVRAAGADPDGLVLAADGVVEARPEALLAMRRAWPGVLVVRWVPGLQPLDAGVDLVAVRVDEDEGVGRLDAWSRSLYRQVIHKYDVEVRGRVLGP